MPAEFEVQLSLDELVPAASAACPAAVSPDPWAGYMPGLACLDGYHSDSDEELWEYVEVEPWPLHGGVMEKGKMKKIHDEFVKEMEEKEKMHDKFEKEQEEKEKMHDEFEGDACSDISEGSVVLFQGGLLQVSRNSQGSGSSEKIRILFRVDGKLGVHVLLADQTLQEWNSVLQAGGREAVQDGYFSTRSGKFFGPLYASWEVGLS